MAALAAVLMLCAGAACTDQPSAPSVIAPYSAIDLRVGTGTVATNGKAISVNYTTWLYDPTQVGNKGPQIDSNVGFAFALGQGSVVAGFDQGVAGMQEGGIRRVVVPPSLGYGGDRRGPIPPYSTLIFEIELVTVSS